GTVRLQSSLIEAVNAVLSSGGPSSFLTVSAGGALTDTASGPSPSALLTATGGSLTASTGNFVNVTGNGFPAGTAAMTLARPLFAGDGTPVDAFFHFLRIGDGGAVTSTATAPFLQFTGRGVPRGRGGSARAGAGGGRD